MQVVTIREAKARLNALVEAALRGEQVVLMRGSEHVAAIVPVSAEDLELSPRLSDPQAERFWQQLAAERGVELGPGASLGAFSLVASGSREVRAETTSQTRILVLRRSSFRRFADAEPRAACRLLEAILRETSRLGREAIASTTAGGVDRVSRDD